MILSTWYYHICAHETLRIITHVNISSATKPNGINIRLVLEWNVIWALYGLMSCQFTPSVHLTGSWYYPFFTCIIPTMLWYMRIMNGELHMDLLVTWPKREDADCDIESCDIEVYNNYYTPKCSNMVDIDRPCLLSNSWFGDTFRPATLGSDRANNLHCSHFYSWFWHMRETPLNIKHMYIIIRPNRLHIFLSL